jgi:hypothetical protein
MPFRDRIAAITTTSAVVVVASAAVAAGLEVLAEADLAEAGPADHGNIRNLHQQHKQQHHSLIWDTVNG